MTELITPYLPQVYCASPWARHVMWEKASPLWFEGRVTPISRWHTTEGQLLDDSNAGDCLVGWQRNLDDIKRADAVIAYAEHKDRPNGTLFEIGYAHAIDVPVFLVGNFPWGTWRHLPGVKLCLTIKSAVDQIVHAKELAHQ